jgi:hypothetical protein
MKLNHLTDKTLLNDTKILIAQERNCLTKILYHLREIETRRLFAELKYGSLFEYAVKELGYSEAAANRRIHSARLLKEMPELDKKFESGELSITNATMASQLFKNEGITDKRTKRNILKRIEGKSRREAEKALLTFSTPNKIPPGQEVKRISEDTHTLKLVISDKTLEKFENLKKILARKNLNQDEMLDYMILAATEKAEKTNVKVRTAPAQSPEARVITTGLKRNVFKRDHGKCQNCKSNYKVEIDHILPYSMGGKTVERNLRLLCFSCNQRQRITQRLYQKF